MTHRTTPFVYFANLVITNLVSVNITHAKFAIVNLVIVNITIAHLAIANLGERRMPYDISAKSLIMGSA